MLHTIQEQNQLFDSLIRSLHIWTDAQIPVPSLIKAKETNHLLKVIQIKRSNKERSV